MPKGQLQTNKAANPLVMFRIKGLMTSSLTSTQRTTWGQTDNLIAPTKFKFETPSAGGIRWRSFCHATFRKQHLGLVKQACWPRQQDARPNLNPDGSQGDPLPRIPKMWGMELFRKKKIWATWTMAMGFRSAVGFYYTKNQCSSFFQKLRSIS